MGSGWSKLTELMQLKRREIVLAGRVVAVPGDDVEWGVVEVGRPEVAEEFGDDLEGAVVAVVVGGDRGEEVAGVGETVGADGAEFGEAESWPVVFEDVAAGLRVEQLDAELDAARNDGDFAGCEVEDAEFGVEHEAAELGDEEQLAVGGVEEAVGHAFGWRRRCGWRRRSAW